MSQLTTSYPVFEGNQVLTSSQLNQLATYLDEQNRLTRTKLIGTGVMCGLELSLDSSPTILNISKGLGVTSEGYITSVGDCTMDRYKVYNLPQNLSYPPFEDPATRTQDVSLYELVAQDAQVLPGEDVKNLDDPAGFLDDKVVMLFMECLDVDLKSCLGQNCDERGKDRVFTLRKLLISKNDLVQKVFPRTCTQTTQFPNKYSLPQIIIRRALFEPGSPESTDYFAFSQNYITDAIKGDKFVSPFDTTKSGLYEQLFDALRQTYTDFAAVLAPVYNGVNPFDNLPKLDWNQYLDGALLGAGPKYFGIQYFYDFIKDLILAYDEFYEVAVQLMSECCPSSACFPKHLLLGEAVPGVNANLPSEFRHGFTLSPAFDQQKSKLDQAIMLHRRMVLMTRMFNFDLVNNPPDTPVPPGNLTQPILITPSNEKRDPLSDRAIPFYYKVSEVDPDLGTLEDNWSFEFERLKLSSHGLKPLSYQNQNPVVSNDTGPVESPLYYNIDPYNFLRIEGAFRQNYQVVEQELEALKTRFNLPFNYLTLRLGGDPLDNILERCNFDDIETEYGSIAADISGTTKGVFDNYAIVQNGRVSLKAFPGFLTGLIDQADSGSNLGSVTQAQIGIERKSDRGKEKDIPIYAPQRTMSEAVQYFKNNVSDLVDCIFTLRTKQLPLSIGDFDYGYTGKEPNKTDGFIQTYMSGLQFANNILVAQNQILDLVTRSTTLENSDTLYANLNQYFSQNSSANNKFVNGTQANQMTLLYYRYQYRLNYLLENDITIFSNFIKKHSGVEHQAGVPYGGTYIMLVNGESVGVSEPIREATVNLAREKHNLEVDAATLRAQPVKTKAETVELERITSTLLNLEQLTADLAQGVPVESIDFDAFQVFADFTLPYVCCCDCGCGEVPPPTSIAELNLPALSMPFTMQYTPGDYAYSKKMSMRSAVGESMTIDVLSAIQFDPSQFPKSHVKLYLVDSNGNKLEYSTIGADGVPVSGSFTPMSTTNHPNDPGNRTQYGTVSVIVANGVSTSLQYQPLQGFSGVDSFKYMFEIIDSNGVAQQRSSASVINLQVT